jgi:hypothetical protein
MSEKREKLGFLCGDSVRVADGRRGVAVRTPQVFVLYEDGSIELVPVRLVEPSADGPVVSKDDALRASEQCAELYRNGKLRRVDDVVGKDQK